MYLLPYQYPKSKIKSFFFLSKIAEDWPGLPNDIDAAVTLPKTGHTYFFKGKLYWKFENQNALTGYPKLITTNWDGIPNNLDTAFRWAGKVITYSWKKQCLMQEKF